MADRMGDPVASSGWPEPENPSLTVAGQEEVAGHPRAIQQTLEERQKLADTGRAFTQEKAQGDSEFQIRMQEQHQAAKQHGAGREDLRDTARQLQQDVFHSGGAGNSSGADAGTGSGAGANRAT